MTDPALFGDQFAGESFAAWRALLAGFYGLKLSKDELHYWRELTGRESAPEAAHDELWMAIGRRGGKSQAAALLAVFHACFIDYTDQLSPGEVATVLCLAADRKQARAVFRYVTGLMNGNPMLQRLIMKETNETLELTNRTVIEVGTASFRSTRGYTFAAVIADEIAFFRDSESANPDHEILNAVRPGLATLDGPLITLSSPYARRGALWDAHRRYFGKDGPILVAQAPTLTMNPTLPRRIVDQALERDPAAAASEYLAQFRDDISDFIARDTVEAVTRPNPLVMPFDRKHKYFAFADPAGGGADEFCLAIGHLEDERIIVDCLLGRRGVPADIVAEYAGVLRQYCISDISADRYAGSWPSDEFARHHIRVETASKAKSDLYRDALATLNSGRCELPPDEKLINQLTSLERRTSRGGRDSIDHPPGGHDDRANVVLGIIANKSAPRKTAGVW
ncbi:MAG: hypothetical protein HLX50_02595 [Alteromonadaceae bacterium]|nr:hypothetical protein [Alteromonadaceae bacterium]